jgi:hypothetical protein
MLRVLAEMIAAIASVGERVLPILEPRFWTDSPRGSRPGRGPPFGPQRAPEALVCATRQEV